MRYEEPHRQRSFATHKFLVVLAPLRRVSPSGRRRLEIRDLRMRSHSCQRASDTIGSKSPLLCFAQQVNGYGKAGDVFLGISTSGNSKNILFAATTAHAKGLKVIGLTGAKDSKLKDMSDVCIKASQTETYMIQELHLPIYHCLCLMLEDKFFTE